MIRKIMVVAVAAWGLSLSAVPATAQDLPEIATGHHCGVISISDPTIEGGEVQTGETYGGPLAAVAPGATISMKCTIQVGAANLAHNGTDSAVAASAPSLQVTAIPLALVSWLSPDGQPVVMCTEVNINGIPYYWDGDPDSPTNGTWQLSSSVGCAPAIQQEIFPGPLCTATLLLHNVLGQNFDGLGIIVIGQDGDLWVAGFWLVDCRPFGNPPPQVLFPHPIICGPLGSLAGTYGALIIDTDGDIFIDLDLDGTPDYPDELVLDCPPYGDNAPPPVTVDPVVPCIRLWDIDTCSRR